LVKALDSKELAGAGLDVTDRPLPKGHPLWSSRRRHHADVRRQFAGIARAPRGRIQGKHRPFRPQ